MQVKRCRFLIWYDSPINDEHAKTMIIKLKNANKDLVQEKLSLINENTTLTRMLAKIKIENTCLRKISSISITDDLCDEVATLKADIEVLQAKLQIYEVGSRREAKKKLYKYVLIISWLIILYLTLGHDSYEPKTSELLVLP